MTMSSLTAPKPVVAPLTDAQRSPGYWQSVGAQLSEEITNLLKRHPAPAAQ